MSTIHQFISVNEFCDFHNVEKKILFNLEDMGVLKLYIFEDTPHLSFDVLERVERLLRIQRDFEMRIQDLDIIDVLLSKIDILEKKIQQIQ